jgi:purine-binding chemotaxis protein CheW
VSQLHVVFRVGETEYAVPAGEVVMMESWGGATPVPGAPGYVAGLVQVRGEVVPVVDMRVRFGLPPVEASLDTRVLVICDDQRKVGLKVDQAREVVRIDEARLREPPEEIARASARFVRSIAQTDDRLLMVIDGPRVIGAEEELDG